MPTKTRRTKHDTGKRYKTRGFRRPLVTTSSCGTVFYENGFSVISTSLRNIHERFSRPQPQNHIKTRIYCKNWYFEGIRRQIWMTKIVSKPWCQKRSAGVCDNGPPYVAQHRETVFYTMNGARPKVAECCFWVFEGHQTRGGGERISVIFLQRIVL